MIPVCVCFSGTIHLTYFEAESLIDLEIPHNAESVCLHVPSAGLQGYTTKCGLF